MLTRLIARRGRRDAERGRAAAQLHLPAQRRPRDDDQPDRQRPGLPARLARREGAPARRARSLIAHARSRSSCASRARTSSATASRPCATEIGGVALRAAHAGDARHRRRQPRPGAVRRPGPARHRAHAEPARRLRLGHPPVRRHGPRAARRPGRDRPLPGALSRTTGSAAPAVRARRARFRGHARLLAVVDPLPTPGAGSLSS